MAKTYQIITDSSCDLPQSLADALDVSVFPLHYYLGQEHYHDYLDARELSFEEFFARIREGVSTSTSAASPGEITQTLEAPLKAGLDVLYIGFSSGLSSNYQCSVFVAQTLREQYPERTILALDSLCASLGQGLFVYLAAQKQREGASLQELYEYLTELRPHLCHWFTVNDLMYLKRGGRISATTAVAGTVLQIKPVMHMDDEGHLVNVSKAKGRKASLAALAAKVLETGTNLEDQTVFICHGDCLADAEFVADRIRQNTPVKDIIIRSVGPAIGAHTGPGVVSVFFVGTQR